DRRRRTGAPSRRTGLNSAMKILILGVTTEARRLAGRLATRIHLEITLSLAGRTAQPAAQSVPVRIGGFGGAEGLADYLCHERVNAIIDATHPYAAAIFAHSAAAPRPTDAAP